jgi:23S rRNA pseudouridine1911/1915/1917 synthase
MEVVYEDNHIIIVNKRSGEIVQGDKTGDTQLSEIVKAYIKEKYGKPGAVFLGVVHRLDRPVWGLVVFAKTSKALSRLNTMFANGDIHKTYWAITKNRPAKDEDVLINWMVRNEKLNKSFIYSKSVPEHIPDDQQSFKDNKGNVVKLAKLHYKLIGSSNNYNLLEIELMTGRHHQIRCQLAAIGCPIKGDLKYGASRSNPDGSISLFAHKVEFVHPVSKTFISVEAPLPDDNLFRLLAPE